MDARKASALVFFFAVGIFGLWGIGLTSPKGGERLAALERRLRALEKRVASLEVRVRILERQIKRSERLLPLPLPSGAKYVGSTRSLKWHRPTCEWAHRIAPANRVFFKSRQEAFRQGYRRCKVCRP